MDNSSGDVKIEENLGVGGTASVRLHVFGQETRLQLDSTYLSFYNTSGTRRGYIQFHESDGLLIEQEFDKNITFRNNGTGHDVVITSDGQVYGGVTALSEASTVTIDFDSTNLQTLEYTGTCGTLATTGLAAGKTVEIRIYSNDSVGITDFTPTTPAWKEIATSITSAGVTNGSYGILKLTSWGTADTDVTAELQVTGF